MEVENLSGPNDEFRSRITGISYKTKKYKYKLHRIRGSKHVAFIPEHLYNSVQQNMGVITGALPVPLIMIVNDRYC